MVNNSGIASPNSWLEICDNVAFVLQNKGTLDIYVIASDGAKVNDLILRPSGESIVAGKHIVRSVNGVAAGVDGNVSLNGGGDLMTVSTSQTIVGTKNFNSIQINGYQVTIS